MHHIKIWRDKHGVTVNKDSLSTLFLIMFMSMSATTNVIPKAHTTTITTSFHYWTRGPRQKPQKMTLPFYSKLIIKTILHMITPNTLYNILLFLGVSQDLFTTTNFSWVTWGVKFTYVDVSLLFIRKAHLVRRGRQWTGSLPRWNI